MKVALASAQRWMHQRMQQLGPADFGNIRFISLGRIASPHNFEHMWRIYNSGDPLEAAMTEEEAVNLDAAVLVANYQDQQQFQALMQLIALIDALGQYAPPMLLLNHTVRLEERPPAWNQFPPTEVVTDLQWRGLDYFIAEEPEGFDLVWTITTKAARSMALSEKMNAVFNQQEQIRQVADYYADCVHTILWDYSRIRMARCIPPLDPTIASGGNPGRVHDLEIGPLLGEGQFGSVHLAHPNGHRGNVQVVKVMNKSKVNDIPCLKNVKRMVDIMQTLSSQWSHPNIVNFYNV